MIVVPAGTAIPIDPAIPNPAVARSEFSAHLLGSVGGPVVGDHDFDVFKSLFKQPLQRLSHEALSVVDGHSNTQGRIPLIDAPPHNCW
jgi:hypothetical protein